MFERKNVKLYRGLALVGAALMCVCIFGATILESYRPMIDNALKTTSVEWVTDGEKTYDFTVDYDASGKLIEAHKKHAVKVQEEGSVLLKNINGALPVKKNAKITLLGTGSHRANYGGGIGSDVLAEQTVTLETAFKEKGFEINPVMQAAYTALEATYKQATLHTAMSMGQSYKKFKTNEPPVEAIEAVSPDYKKSFSEYSDAAIVVFTRPGTEAGDYFPGENGKDPADGGSENALGLDGAEEQILKLAKDNFNTVIVLINAINQMELDNMKHDDGVDAILWIGFPGNYGSRGVANILCGEDDDGNFVSPSGALIATYAANSASAPATQNFGFYRWSNWTDIGDDEAANTYRGNEYLVEAEGIYVGYRYYETRYYDAIMRPQSKASSAAGDFTGDDGVWKYTDEVSYSFGYGLSYSSFERTLKKVEVAADKKTAKVYGSVTNVGEKATKTPVEIYVQLPYIEGGLEKSTIQLIDYAKTPIIDAGQTYDFEIDVDLSYLATYDSSNGGRYVVDGGDYYFATGNGAHDALNNILSACGKTTADGMDYDGDSRAVVKTKVFGAAGTADYEIFSTTKAGEKVSNKLADADINYFTENAVTYLSRSDYNTFPKTYDQIKATPEMIALLKNDGYTFGTNEEKAREVNFATGEENGLSLYALKGADYDDERWDKLLAQIDLDELLNTIARAQDIILGIPSISLADVNVAGDALGMKRILSQYSDRNAPWWQGKNPLKDENANYRVRDTYPLVPVLCSTFNKDLANERGVLLGNVSLYTNVTINWGPCLNLYRSPYYGRMQENSGEDPLLGAYQAASLANGAWAKGCAVTVKHFAGNNIEINRTGLSQFNTEQGWRELELRGFQIALENGVKGVMTSYSRVGCVWSGGNKNLVSGILKDEWGVHGYIVSDMIHNPGESTYMAMKEACAAGTALMDNATDFLSNNSTNRTWRAMTKENVSKDGELLETMKRSCKDLLWLLANSNAMNGKSSSMRMVNLLSPWRIAYIAAIAVSSVVFVGATAFYIVTMLKNKKEGERQ